MAKMQNKVKMKHARRLYNNIETNHKDKESECVDSIQLDMGRV
jgi:hypothetical protein